ncbi:hypothetical protein [Flyfo podovirus Tbat2_2]|nr:hypothetical protein [Flyfo podovirus Tbat2_2]
MIELKITGDALEVKKEIENLFNMTTGAQQVLSVVDIPVETTVQTVEGDGKVKIKVDELIVDGGEHTADLSDGVAERDNRGFLWDERIHSTGKTMNKDGTWRNKKGVDPILLETVESELAKEASDEGVIETENVPDAINPEVTEVDPPVEASAQDAQSAMIKFTQSITHIKDDKGVPKLGDIVTALMKKIGKSSIVDIKENDERVEFIDLCNKVIATPEKWEEILG